MAYTTDEAWDAFESEMEALEKSEVDKAAARSFTNIQMVTHLEGDVSTVIIKGHLYFERVLIVAIQDALSHPEEINVRQLSFPAKLNLAAALGQLPKELKSAGTLLNETRNKLAHRLEYEFTLDDWNKFWLCLPVFARKTLLDFKRIDETQKEQLQIQHFVISIIMHAENYRVSRAIERARERTGLRRLSKAVKLAEPGMRANGLIRGVEKDGSQVKPATQ